MSFKILFWRSAKSAEAKAAAKAAKTAKAAAAVDVAMCSKANQASKKPKVSKAVMKAVMKAAVRATGGIKHASPASQENSNQTLIQTSAVMVEEHVFIPASSPLAASMSVSSSSSDLAGLGNERVLSGEAGSATPAEATGRPAEDIVALEETCPTTLVPSPGYISGDIETAWKDYTDVFSHITAENEFFLNLTWPGDAADAPGASSVSSSAVAMVATESCPADTTAETATQPLWLTRRVTDRYVLQRPDPAVTYQRGEASWGWAPDRFAFDCDLKGQSSDTCSRIAFQNFLDQFHEVLSMVPGAPSAQHLLAHIPPTRTGHIRGEQCWRYVNINAIMSSPPPDAAASASLPGPSIADTETELHTVVDTISAQPEAPAAQPISRMCSPPEAKPSAFDALLSLWEQLTQPQLAASRCQPQHLRQHRPHFASHLVA